MVTADFDQDGDIDLAGAGYSGEVVVLENKGSLLTGAFGRTVYPAPTEAYFGTERIALVDMNHDSDPDFVIGSGRGAMIYLGQPGMAFGFDSELSNPRPDFSCERCRDARPRRQRDAGDDRRLSAGICINILTSASAGRALDVSRRPTSLPVATLRKETSMAMENPTSSAPVTCCGRC